MIRFRFTPEKALEAVEWMLGRRELLDFHTILKTAYFADRAALNEFGRPVFGATYKAMNYGPVPLEIYEMLKCEPYWLSELERGGYPWEREGYHLRLKEAPRNREPEHLSEEDVRLLDEAFDRSLGMTFDERTRETHGLDWLRGIENPAGIMKYEDMIDLAHPRRDELIRELEKLGPHLVL